MFDIKIAPNQAFDYKDQPFKLEFTRIEPEESLNSPFEIEPKNCIIRSKEVKEFTVTFNSDQGIDKFSSVCLSHPQIAIQGEIDSEDDELKAAASRPLGLVSVRLLAETV
jgi:hypothetical protein